MSATGSRTLLPAALGLLLGAAAAAPGQPSVRDLPAIDRRADHFYHALAAGPRGVQAAWTADPTTVPLDGELTLTLTVRNAANPAELARPDLRKMPAFAEKFQVLDPPVQPPAAEGRFVYVLRPRSADVTAVPALKYVYYRPDFPEGKRFQTTYAKAVPVAVTPPAPRPTPTAPAVPLDGPEEFFALAPAHRDQAVGQFAWVYPVTLIPFAVVGWVAGWRFLFPGAAVRAKRRRSRAARAALNRLRAARRSPDPAAAAGSAVRGYLASRFGVPPTARTPGEVAAGLRTAEPFAGMAADAERFLRSCDAARFAPVGDDGSSRAAEAEGLIAAWEGVGA